MLANNAQYLFWSIIFYNVSTCLTKVSILLQYGRIFSVQTMRIPLYIVMAMCVLWGISTIVTSIFTCQPAPNSAQTPDQKKPKCINVYT